MGKGEGVRQCGFESRTNLASCKMSRYRPYYGSMPGQVLEWAMKVIKNCKRYLKMMLLDRYPAEGKQRPAKMKILPVMCVLLAASMHTLTAQASSVEVTPDQCLLISFIGNVYNSTPSRAMRWHLCV
jgi:hypothetical protein